MTLFTLLLVMALERVTSKSKRYHISNLAVQYFCFLQEKNWLKEHSSIGASVAIGLLPALIAWLGIVYLPGIFVLAIYVASLWICLGCPHTRKTYKQYLQAANRDDLQACSFYSESLGNKSGSLSQLGKHLVLINYRHYASVVIFLVLFGVPGMIFYSIIKELFAYQQNLSQGNDSEHTNIDYSNTQTPSATAELPIVKVQKLLHVLDVVPARITAFGFLVVGNFSQGLSAWLTAFTQVNMTTYDLLASVAKASEAPEASEKPYLHEPLQMVKLAKRNIIFLLVAISVMTLVGLVA